MSLILAQVLEVKDNLARLQVQNKEITVEFLPCIQEELEDLAGSDAVTKMSIEFNKHFKHMIVNEVQHKAPEFSYNLEYVVGFLDDMLKKKK